MTSRDGRQRWAWVVWAITMAIAIFRPIFGAALEGLDEGPLEYIFTIAAIAASATVGALITSRQPGNRIGLLFSALAGAAAVSITSGAYSGVAIERELPLPGFAAWLSQLTFALMLFPLAFLFLLYPDGQVPTPRWRWVLRVMLVAFAVNVVLFALTPGVIGSGFTDVHDAIVNPIALPMAWQRAIQSITELAGFVVLIGALLSVISLFLRFRRADPEQRQQIRWLAYLGAFLGSTFIFGSSMELIGVFPEDEESVIGNAVFFVFIIGLFLGIPATCAIAILRYRLYDLDIVVKKTVLYFVLVGLIVALTGLLAFLLGSVFVVSDDLSPGALVTIGVAVGLLVWPLRRLATRISDRLVYGGRTSSYEAMAAFSHRVADTYASDDVLPRMAAILAETTRAEKATIWLRIGGDLVPAATTGATAPDPVPAAGGDLPRLPADHSAPVRHQGELLGALAVSMPANDPIDRKRERLVDDLAAQAGAVLRNVRLIEELRASRQRLVTAQDEERRKLERNIHDGAQQQLVALSVKLRLLEQISSKDPAKASELASQLQAEATDALEDLRDLARGIYPPLLADQGLPAALEAQARKSPVPVSVMPDGVGRYAPEVESAVYFCCLEALQNVAKYAEAGRVEVRLSASEQSLSFEVSDDGCGFDPGTAKGSGLQGMADRLDALGGTLSVRSEPGSGTSVVGRVPLARRQQLVASET
jgi:signal transduction histidine kinase